LIEVNDWNFVFEIIGTEGYREIHRERPLGAAAKTVTPREPTS